VPKLLPTLTDGLKEGIVDSETVRLLSPHEYESGLITFKVDDTDSEAFVSHVLDSLSICPANFEDIIPTNLGRVLVDDETTFEMELGSNNCTVGS
jgi:hypothetical protein